MTEPANTDRRDAITESPVVESDPFTREGGWVPHEVSRGEALSALPCIVYIGGHNFVCITPEDERAVVDRCGLAHLRWFINGAEVSNAR